MNQIKKLEKPLLCIFKECHRGHYELMHPFIVDRWECCCNVNIKYIPNNFYELEKINLNIIYETNQQQNRLSI